jgi:guanosine-3',5'-bis(diphosphate) 3'-pyrophosphohydrolase
MDERNKVSEILRALHFAADKHREQKRSDIKASPYINHPIEVAELLSQVGGVTNLITLQGAILHDTIEDTNTKPDELDAAFGPRVRSLVEEITDDKSLPKGVRKDLQIEHAPICQSRLSRLRSQT